MAFPYLRHFPLYCVEDCVKSWFISSDMVPIFCACRFITNFQSLKNNSQKGPFTLERGVLLNWLQLSQSLSLCLFFMLWNQYPFSIVIHSCLMPPSPFGRQKLYCANIYFQYISWFSTFSAFTSIISVERETVAILNYTEGLFLFPFLIKVCSGLGLGSDS